MIFLEMLPIKTMSPTVDDEVIFKFWGWLVEILVINFADRAQG